MSDSGLLLPNFLAIRSLNHALPGDADSARATFTAAVDAGYREYFLIVNDPAWAEMLALPGFAELLQIMKQDIDRQRDAVVTIDAEDGFRALVEKLFPL